MSVRSFFRILLVSSLPLLAARPAAAQDPFCVTWVPAFGTLALPICEPFKSTWIDQYNRWVGSGFRSYFVGLPMSKPAQIYNYDANRYVRGQMFERGILHEWAPEPSGVAGMRLGDLDRDLNGVPYVLDAAPTPDFQAVWESQGGLPVFGRPVSEPQWRPVQGEWKWVQYFERARMERRQNEDLVEFGLLTVELNQAGRIYRQQEEYMATVECRQCSDPIYENTSRTQTGNTCEAAYKKAENACIEIGCSSSFRKGCK